MMNSIWREKSLKSSEGRERVALTAASHKNQMKWVWLFSDVIFMHLFTIVINTIRYKMRWRWYVSSVRERMNGFFTNPFGTHHRHESRLSWGGWWWWWVMRRDIKRNLEPCNCCIFPLFHLTANFPCHLCELTAHHDKKYIFNPTQEASGVGFSLN